MSSSRQTPERGPDARTGRHGTIRGRLARILALPAVVVLLLLGLLAAGQVQDFRSSRDTSRSVDLALALQDLVHELQTERGITAAVQGGNTSFTNELAPARTRVDQKLAQVRRQIGAGGLVAVNARVRRVLTQLDGLTNLRSATDKAASAAASSAERSAATTDRSAATTDRSAATTDRAATDRAAADRQRTFAFYTDRIAAISGVDVGLDAAADPQLRRGVATLQALQDAIEATAQERAFLNGVFSASGFAPGEFVRFAGMRADKTSALERFDRLATADQRASMTYVLGTGAARTTDYFEQVALDAAAGNDIVVNPQSWWSGLTTVLDDLAQLQEHVGSVIQVRAYDVQQQAAFRLGGLVGLVVLCFVGSAYLASLASRSITRPLAVLASEADKVAAERLPQAVRRIQSGDQTPTQPEPVETSAQATAEIRQVATALERLQTAAYGLAVEQTMQRRDTVESLANLGRRNQNLIRRQLGFITSLEREEVDPTALANLFELDHLATRMRRNAASLLVLVGESSPRQWSSALPVADVIRAAVSEVEDYRRVLLRRVDDVPVHGSAIGSVAHLLSELIENGLQFSPPDTDVEVQGRRLPAGYLIAVTDQGMGMSPSEMREANARLQGQDDFVSAPTRYLGHHVIGKLAAETGVRVELIPSPVTGVTARVLLPETLLQPLRAVERNESRSAALPSGQPSSGQPDLVAEPVPDGTRGALAQPLTDSRPEPELVSVGRAVPGLSPPRNPPIPDQVAGQSDSPTSTGDRSVTPEPIPGFHMNIDLTPAAGTPRDQLTGADAPDEVRSARAEGAAGGAGSVTRNGLRKRAPRASAAEDSRHSRVIDLDRATEYEVSPPTAGTAVTAGFSALRSGMARRAAGPDGGASGGAGGGVVEGPVTSKDRPASDSGQSTEDNE